MDSGFLRPGGRIVVVGTSGAGKTTLARRLCQNLGLRDIELDALHWLPDWQQSPHEEFRKKVDDATSSPGGWVVHGNYSKVHDLTLGRADGLIWLDYSRPVVTYRVLARSLRRIVFREKLWSGNRESFTKTFFSRDSILLWSWTSHGKNQTRYSKMMTENPWPHLQILRLQSPKQLEQVMSSVSPNAGTEWGERPPTV